ncbi:MAG: amidohydrolase family protein [Acidobacteria bacterium]|nr:amidohydrolase family protein [Acidobacteriota bacterium]
MRQQLLSLLLLACAAMIPTSAEVPSLIAIQDARIVTVSGAVIEKGNVVLNRGIITDVGPAAAIPKGAWIVDGKGLTVYPGLIDAFSTWGIPEAATAAPATGGGRGGAIQVQITPGQAATPQATPARSQGPQDRPGTNSWVKAADLVKPTDRRLDQARGAGFTSAVTFPRQGLIGGHGAVVNLGGETSGKMIVEPDAGLHMTTQPSGYSGYPNSLMGVFAYFRQLWLDAGHYKLSRELYAQSPASVPRPEYDRALEGILGARRLLLPASGPIQLDRMTGLSADLKTPAVYWGVVEGYRMADTLKKAGASVILNVKWPVKERDTDPEQVDSLRTLELRDKAPTSPAILAAAGVRFAVSSDGIDAPRDIIRALKKSIDLGLKKEDALRALTLSAAEIYGVSARLGSIEKGKIANLIVTTGDLFDDKTKVQLIFVDGVKYLPPPETPQGPAGGFPGGRPGPTGPVDQEVR